MTQHPDPNAQSNPQGQNDPFGDPNPEQPSAQAPHQGGPQTPGYAAQPGPGYGAPQAPTKSHVAAILLSFFLGTFGIDRFYLGHIGLGIAKLLLSWATFGVWQIIDFIIIIVKGTPGLKQINWQ